MKSKGKKGNTHTNTKQKKHKAVFRITHWLSPTSALIFAERVDILCYRTHLLSEGLNFMVFLKSFIEKGSEIPIGLEA